MKNLSYSSASYLRFPFIVITKIFSIFTFMFMNYQWQIKKTVGDKFRPVLSMLKTLVLSQVKPENYMRDWNYKPKPNSSVHRFLCNNAWLCEKNIRVKPLIGNIPSNTRTCGNYRINGFDDNKWSWMLIWITKVKKIFPMNINLPPLIESTPLISHSRLDSSRVILPTLLNYFI